MRHKFPALVELKTMAPLIFLLALVAWVVACAPALIYAAIIEGRRRRDVAALDKKMAAVPEPALRALRVRPVQAAAVNP